MTDATGKVSPAHRKMVERKAGRESSAAPFSDLAEGATPPAVVQPSELGDDFDNATPAEKRERLNAVDPLLAEHHTASTPIVSMDATDIIARLESYTGLLSDNGPSLGRLRFEFKAIRNLIESLILTHS